MKICANNSKNWYAENIFVFLLFLSVSFSVVYSQITRFDLSDSAFGGTDGDIKQYIKIFSGESLETIPKPFRYRILTPVLARFLPFLPKSVAVFYEVDDEKVVKFKFGIVNALFLCFSALYLYKFCRYLAFSYELSLLGGLFFLCSFYVVNYAGMPLVDASAYFIIMASLYAIVKGQNIRFFFLFTLGLFAKETTLLIFIAVFLIVVGKKEKLIKSALCFPGLSAYAVFRFILYPANIGYTYSINKAIQGLKILIIPSDFLIYMAIDGGLAFGFLWIFAAHGYYCIHKNRGHLLIRLLPLFWLIVLLPFLLRTNIGRIWFLSFPIVIPLVLSSIKRFFDKGRLLSRF